MYWLTQYYYHQTHKSVLCKHASTMTPNEPPWKWVCHCRIVIFVDTIDRDDAHSVIIIACKIMSLEMWSKSLSDCEKVLNRKRKWGANYWKWPCHFFIHLINIHQAVLSEWVAERRFSRAESLSINDPVNTEDNAHKHTVETNPCFLLVNLISLRLCPGLETLQHWQLKTLQSFLSKQTHILYTTTISMVKHGKWAPLSQSASVCYTALQSRV